MYRQASRRERSFRGAALGDYDGEEGRADDVCGSNSGTSRDAEKQGCCVLLLEERLPFFKNECVSCFFIAFTLRAFRRKTSRVLVMQENTSLLGEAYVLVCCQYPCCHLKRKNNGRGATMQVHRFYKQSVVCLETPDKVILASYGLIALDWANSS